MSESPYIASLKATFQMLHGCNAEHIETVPVIERFQGKTVWEGEVEVFDLAGHPKAKRGYAWAYDKNAGGSETVAVLEFPPVISPKTAVKAALVAKLKTQSRN
jgi:hypothetical protein